MMKSLEWFRNYSGTIGSSLAPAIVGASPFVTRIQAYHRLRTKPEDLHARQEETPDMRRGRLFEPIAFSILAEGGIEAKPHDQNKFVENAAFPFAHCLPDGFVALHGKMKIIFCPVEIKWPRMARVRRCQLEGIASQKDYFVQAQHHMMITETPSCLFVVCDAFSASAVIEWIERDDAFIKDLAAEEAEFYNGAVEGIEPDEGSAPPSFDVPEAASFLRVTGSEAIEAARRFLNAKEILDDAKQLHDETKVELRDHVGENPIVEIGEEDRPILRVYQTKTTRRSLDEERFRREHPEIDLDAFKKTTESFPFRVFPLGNKMAGY